MSVPWNGSRLIKFAKPRSLQNAIYIFNQTIFLIGIILQNYSLIDSPGAIRYPIITGHYRVYHDETNFRKESILLPTKRTCKAQ